MNREGAVRGGEAREAREGGERQEKFQQIRENLQKNRQQKKETETKEDKKPRAKEKKEQSQAKKDTSDKKNSKDKLEKKEKRINQRTSDPERPSTNIDGEKFPKNFDHKQFLKDRKNENIGLIGGKETKIGKEYFVIHDTSATIADVQKRGEQWKQDKKGVHLLIGRNDIFTVMDFSDHGNGATKFEYKQNHPEFREKMIHVEVVDDEKAKGFNDYQYEKLAESYIEASRRAGEFLTITLHKEVDRGIRVKSKKDGKWKYGHSDPRIFDVNKFYRIIRNILNAHSSQEFSEDAAFGITHSRSKKPAYYEHVNTFPEQYGKIRKDSSKKIK